LEGEGDGKGVGACVAPPAASSCAGPAPHGAPAVANDTAYAPPEAATARAAHARNCSRLHSNLWSESRKPGRKRGGGDGDSAAPSSGAAPPDASGQVAGAPHSSLSSSLQPWQPPCPATAAPEASAMLCRASRPSRCARGRYVHRQSASLFNRPALSIDVKLRAGAQLSDRITGAESARGAPSGSCTPRWGC